MTRAFVTGIGVVSPIGIGVEDFWKSLLNKKSAFSQIEPIYKGQKDKCWASLIPVDSLSRIKSELNEYPSSLPSSSLYALHAALQAVKDAGLTPGDAVLKNALVCIGNNEAEADILDERVEGNLKRWNEHIYSSHSIANIVADAVGSEGPALTIHNTCASGNVALDMALNMIRNGLITTAIIGGADGFSKKVWSGFNILNALGSEPCKPFSVNRRFITIGEGAAFLVIQTSMSSIEASNAYAELVASSINNDAKHPTNPDFDGVKACHSKLLEHAHISADEVDVIFAHGTGTKANDSVEAAIFSEIYKNSAVSAIKGTVGHLMAAAGCVGAIASCLALDRQRIPPTNISPDEFEYDFKLVMNDSKEVTPIRYVQNNSFGFGGNNAITLFKTVHNL
ncbi:beta-ketoacyl synthase N-terminal-like domain-containing protein [Chitinibacter sp. ZOR0017]|uniref:beta-ketoacyl synthase N-terminal-like domain-containing protein n=1 Tax=Chitinibacter sp. ZOR0017 TaxID=1339254 RepID=UPI0009DEE15F|nr:beta-ketoacyl synthase N-terminal-like domain-containing protein [Chitinibacter sp. ZOR0017]